MILLYSIALGLVASCKASQDLPFVRMQDLPGIAEPEKAQWISMSKDVKFLPVDELPQLRQPRRSLPSDEDDEVEEDEEDAGTDTTGMWDEYNPYSVQPFIEGMGDYDEYQQAWRMLGFMIDCNSASNEEQNEHRGSGSNDVTEDGCARYILWAAYVDLEYEGGGIGEYQYWNRTSKSWDTTACQYAEGGSSRCAKMDCHLENTHFSLLGFFKHRSYDDWMGQLFKHEGMCVWSDEEYAFMKSARKALPRGCTNSGATTEEGETIYYDIKPLSGGRITVGLYLDSQCIVDYTSDTSKVEEILGNYFLNQGGSHDRNGNYDFSSDSLKQSLARWTSAFDVFHTCQPCIAYDLENTDGEKYTSGYYYNRDRRHRKLGGESSPKGDVFECYDDAGYTSVNQCMKFSAKTTMYTATFRDLSLARSQNSLAASPLAGYLSSDMYYFRSWIANIITYACLVFATVCLCCACFSLYKAKTETDYDISGVFRDSLLSEKEKAIDSEMNTTGVLT